MSMNRYTFLITALVFLFSFGQKPQAAQIDPALSAGLAPHKALYDVSLIEAESGSQIVNVDGAMAYEWNASCEGWVSDHHFNLVYEYADNPAMSMKSTFSTYESFVDDLFNFTAEKKRNDRVFEEVHGYVADHMAQYEKPEQKDIKLPTGTLHPIAHTLRVLDAIKHNKNFVNAFIFDGSDAEGAVEVNAFIGKAVPLNEIDQNTLIDPTLIKSPARRLRLAFFPANQDSPKADYEMDIVFHENGVISDMIIEYDHFTVRQKLSAVKALTPQCR